MEKKTEKYLINRLEELEKRNKMLEEQKDSLFQLNQKLIKNVAKLSQLKSLFKIEKGAGDIEMICIYDLKGNYKDILYTQFDDDFQTMKDLLQGE